MAKKKRNVVAEQLQHFQACASQVQEYLQPVLDMAKPDNLSKMEPLEQAQVHGTLAHALVTLFAMYLKTQGVDPEQHAVSKEQKRMGLYLAKIEQAVHRKELQTAKQTLEVDVGAANRFISAAMPELTSEQRQKLKEAGQKHATDPPSKRRKSGGKVSAPAGAASAAVQAAALLEDLVQSPAS